MLLSFAFECPCLRELFLMCHPVLMLREVHSTTWTPHFFVDCHSSFVGIGRYFEIFYRCRVVCLCTERRTRPLRSVRLPSVRAQKGTTALCLSALQLG
mmetsp:Transcript_149131/g.362168  ORF Transcript_149131/g.362168 Transcript_149131/m.362168 type:complete len:98 (+) Transcript_149131:1077-1370(+)